MKPQHRAPRVDRPSRSPAPVHEAPVLHYLLNPRGEVEGYLLADGTLLRFPAHLAAKIVQVAAPGDTVRANGQWEDQTTLRGHAVSNSASGVALRDVRPSPADRAASLSPLKPMQVAGRVAHLRRNGRGDPDAAILGDGSIVHVPPHAARRQFVDLLAVGSDLCARGFGAETPYGRSLTAAMLGGSKDSLDLVEAPAARHGPGARAVGGKVPRPASFDEVDGEEQPD